MGAVGPKVQFCICALFRTFHKCTTCREAVEGLVFRVPLESRFGKTNVLLSVEMNLCVFIYKGDQGPQGTAGPDGAAGKAVR